MRLALTFLGRDLFSIEVSTDAPSPAPDEDFEEPGDYPSTPIGFTGWE